MASGLKPMDALCPATEEFAEVIAIRSSKAHALADAAFIFIFPNLVAAHTPAKNSTNKRVAAVATCGIASQMLKTRRLSHVPPAHRLPGEVARPILLVVSNQSTENSGFNP